MVKYLSHTNLLQIHLKLVKMKKIAQTEFYPPKTGYIVEEDIQRLVIVNSTVDIYENYIDQLKYRRQYNYKIKST